MKLLMDNLDFRFSKDNLPLSPLPPPLKRNFLWTTCTSDVNSVTLTRPGVPHSNRSIRWSEIKVQRGRHWSYRRFPERFLRIANKRGTNSSGSIHVPYGWNPSPAFSVRSTWHLNLWRNQKISPWFTLHPTCVPAVKTKANTPEVQILKIAPCSFSEWKHGTKTSPSENIYDWRVMPREFWKRRHLWI